MENEGYDDINTAGSSPGGFLSVEQANSELNSHTYVYEPDRSLRNMTVSGMETLCLLRRTRMERFTVF